MKHVHFIGICGVAMAPIAKMMADLGWKVSGSDSGFYPPVSDYLKKHPEIVFYPGFHPEKMGNPDLVVVGGFISMKNPEFIYARNNNIPYKSYPEVLEEFLIKENSVVCSGTYGKTTSTALATQILKLDNLNPSYMFGGIVSGFSDSVGVTDSVWSVVEGDEYISSRWNPVSKFFYYKPKYLLLTSASWDHSDVFRSEEEFVENFRKLVQTMPSDGIVVANRLDENLDKVIKDAPCKVVRYQGRKSDEANVYNVVSRSPDGDLTRISIECEANGFSESFETTLIGSHMIDNITGVVALLNEAGIGVKSMQDGVSEFRGVKRRLEIRGRTRNGVTIIDDLAHSPAKALAGLHALGHRFPLRTRIFVVYEPNVGNRTIESLPGYDRAFGLAHEVIIPRLSKTKTKKDETRINGKELAKVIEKTQENVKYIEDDDELVKYIKKNTREGDVVVFMGAHGFRGMIEQVLERAG